MVADRAILQPTSVRLSLNNEACQSGVIARGGGHSGTEWIPTAKRLCRAEVVDAKIEGRSALFKTVNF